MSDKKHVLITGSSGLIGGVIRNKLGNEYDFSGVDFNHESGFDVHVADMTDLNAILPAFQGVDTVIDLAAQAENTTEWPRIKQNNLPSTYNAFEAARKAGLQAAIAAGWEQGWKEGVLKRDSGKSD